MSEVSRETPPVPDGARGVFGVRTALAEQYVAWLASAGVDRGLIGPREVPRLWDRHVLNCAGATDLVPEGSRVADLGSGAGLPGLVWAIRRPDLAVTLVESMLRRTTFLEEVVADLGLEGVEVVRARAEDLHGRRTFDVVTSRALAPLPRLAGWSMPLVTATGVMLAIKGERAAAEAAEASDDLVSRGCTMPEVLRSGSAEAGSATLVVRVAWAAAPRVSWPIVPGGAGAPGSKASGRAGRATRGRPGPQRPPHREPRS